MKSDGGGEKALDVIACAPESVAIGMGRAGARAWMRLAPWALTAVFLSLMLLPRVRENTRLAWTFLGVGASLLGWLSLLWFLRGRRALAVEFVRPSKAHYVQACLQLSIYVYWAAYWPRVYQAVPLIAAQLVFFYVLDALLTWSRRRAWRPGFGPLPIIFSTNLFMWFRDDWFMFQFVMLIVIALGKEFIQWNRGGRRRHIFNPAAFGLAVTSIVLITTGTTSATWGLEVAATVGRPPHIYLLIFLLGIVVQYLFSVTLVTLSAAAVLVFLNVVYTQVTGLYQFTDANIPIAVFLGFHLLVTDPATSPRTNSGRILFGGLYGASVFLLYSILLNAHVPEFYDKLLPVPLLNLSVPWIEAVAGVGLLARFDRWQTRFRPGRVNLVYMGGWAALFAMMLATGFVAAPHPGRKVEFWMQAYRDGKPETGRKLFKVIGSAADAGNAFACNKLGEIYMEGELAPYDEAAAAHYFARACELEEDEGCRNVARLALFVGRGKSRRIVEQSFTHLEELSRTKEDAASAYLLGFAYETGRVRPKNLDRAFRLYELGATRGNPNAFMGLVRVAISEDRVWELPAGSVEDLERGSAGGDAECCLYLAYVLRAERGAPEIEARADALIAQACSLGSDHACAVAGEPDRWRKPPPPEPPAMLVPPPFAGVGVHTSVVR